MLSLRKLAKTYPGARGRRVLAGVDLELGRGEYVAVMGESGVGKSTLLNLIAGLDLPDTGSITLDGVDLGSLGDDARTLLRRARMGFVFQAFHLLPHLSAAGNVALPLQLNGIVGAEAQERVARMLEAVGLAGLGGRYPRELSGGEMQRVAIARALVHRPQLLLADEPTGNLDPETGAAVLALLREHAAGPERAGILVTHSRAAAATCDRVLVLTGEGLREAGSR